MTSKYIHNTKVLAALSVLAVVSVVGGLMAYDDSLALAKANDALKLSIDVIPGAYATSDTIEVASYAKYSCHYGWWKCETLKVYRDVGPGDQFTVQAYTDGVWEADSDLELHHEMTNNSGQNYYFTAQHWGYVADYGTGQNRNCNDNGYVEETYRMRDGETQNVRFCHMDGMTDRDRINMVFTIL